MCCRYIGWCIGKCPLYRGVLYSECPLAEVPLYMILVMYVHVHDYLLSQDLDKIVEREEEARTSKQVIRKITYKGEEEIEAERTEAIEVCI